MTRSRSSMMLLNDESVCHLNLEYRWGERRRDQSLLMFKTRTVNRTQITVKCWQIYIKAIELFLNTVLCTSFCDSCLDVTVRSLLGNVKPKPYHSVGLPKSDHSQSSKFPYDVFHSSLKPGLFLPVSSLSLDLILCGQSPILLAVSLNIYSKIYKPNVILWFWLIA